MIKIPQGSTLRYCVSMRHKTLKIIAVIIALGLTVEIFSAISARSNLAEDPKKVNEVTITTPFPPPKIVGENKLYQSQLLRFSILYPKNLSVKEYGEGNTSTITFEDATSTKSFQIFVVPYQESQISDERFKMDVPSGVMKEPIDVIIGGIRGTMFYSQNAVLGETREVWFVNNGFLYEITAYADLDSWLAEILSTWQFR